MQIQAVAESGSWMSSENLSKDVFIFSCFAVLRIRIRDPVPFLPLDPGSGMGRESASGSGIRDEQPRSYCLELRNYFFGFFGVKILKFFDADPGSGMETVLIRDGKKSDPGSWINIPDPQHGFFGCQFWLAWIRIRIPKFQSGSPSTGVYPHISSPRLEPQL
jgi:hypothetical protein